MAYLPRIELLKGNCNSIGLAEVKFKYPLKTPREKELHAKALNIINDHPYFVRYYWSIVSPENVKDFNYFLKTEGGATIAPYLFDVMHGEIGFITCANFPLQDHTSKEPLIELCLRAGIPLSPDAMTYRHQRLAIEFPVLGFAVSPQDLDKEIRASFENHIFLMYE